VAEALECTRREDGGRQVPAIEFDDGTWYRDESKEMAAAIRAGRLYELHGKTPAAETTA
jgi:hypothetical protein